MADNERHDKSVRPPTDVVLLSDVTPTTTIEAPEGTRGLLIGTAGALSITTRGGGQRDSVPFQAGVTPLEITEIRDSTGSTVANIWALV